MNSRLQRTLLVQTLWREWLEGWGSCLHCRGEGGVVTQEVIPTHHTGSTLYSKRNLRCENWIIEIGSIGYWGRMRQCRGKVVVGLVRGEGHVVTVSIKWCIACQNRHRSMRFQLVGDLEEGGRKGKNRGRRRVYSCRGTTESGRMMREVCQDIY